MVTELVAATDGLFQKVDDQYEETTLKFDDIKKTWFDALYMQLSNKQIQDKIISKIEKISLIQDDVSGLIDALSVNIQQVDLDELDGESTDMLIQKQIVAASTLLEKVDELKDKIDAGELDGDQ